MRGYIGNTDYDWFTFLRAIEPPIDEVNFWKPGSDSTFKAIEPGAPFFFRLKSPHNAIGGFGFFAHYSTLPVSMVWQVYGVGNGAATFREIRDRLLKFRRRFDMATDPKQDFWIGCILVNQPVFFEEADWVRLPSDWAGNIVQGKTYDLATGEGARIWAECLERATRTRSTSLLSTFQSARPSLVASGGFGAPQLVRPRLGQRSFRVAILDTYQRRCAITNEKTLPALEAAHIRDFSTVQEHSINNGILFRADIHKLFDSGYVTVTPEHRFEVSRRIKEEFENGKDYYRLHGIEIRLPLNAIDRPLPEALVWHNEQRYLG